MMTRLLVIIIICSCLVNCSPAKKTGSKPAVVEIGPAEVGTDSINYNEERYTVSKIITPQELEGKWFVLTMRRQPFMPAEPMEGVTISFAESSFASQAPCNSVAGDFDMKGSKAAFTSIVGTKMACNKLEQETAFLKLLENAVKVIGVEGNKLMLKDKTGNTIFECVKDK